MNSIFIFLSFIINFLPFFTLLKLERKKEINVSEIKKQWIRQFISQKEWKLFSQMEKILYWKDIRNFLYGSLRNKVYQIKRKNPCCLSFRIKQLELMENKKKIYLIALGEKEIALLNENLDIFYFRKFKEKIDRYVLGDLNSDGEDELYLIFKNKFFYFSFNKEQMWELENGWLTSQWCVSDGNTLFLLFSDSIIILDKELRIKKLYPEKNEKFILLTFKKDGLVILSKLENRSLVAYSKTRKIEIFGNFRNIEATVFKEGFLIKANDDLFFINCSLSYFERISEYYRIKRIKDCEIFDLNGDKRKDIVVSDGNYLFYFLNNFSALESLQKNYYQELITKIKLGDLRSHQDILVTLLNLSAQVGLPFLEIEEKIEKMIKKYYVAKIQQRLLVTSFFLILLGFFVLIFVRPFFLKVKNKKWCLENRSFPQIIKIAENLIALNYNYLVKGNYLEAQNQIKKIMKEFKLIEKEVQYLKETLEPRFFVENYLILLERLLNNKNIVDLIILLEDINMKSNKKLNFQKTNYLEIENYFKKDGYYLLQICEPFSNEGAYKIFLSNNIRRLITSLIGNYVKHAKKRAFIILEKKTISSWQRKIILSFYSDANMDINSKEKSLVEEIRKKYHGYLDIFYGFRPSIKLTFIFSDLIGIIEEIIKNKRENFYFNNQS